VPTGDANDPGVAPTAPPDATAILKSLDELVQKNKDQSNGGGKSWVGTLIIIAAGLAAAAVWAWIEWRRGKELAQLRHEAEAQRLQAEHDAVDKAVALALAEIARFQKLIDDAKARIEAIEVKVTEVEAQRAADKKAIDRVRSWRDVDPDYQPKS
jgi:septal ring factor EnvC (AmiA/AmiB activator)